MTREVLLIAFTISGSIAAVFIFVFACLGLWHLDIFNRPKITPVPPRWMETPPPNLPKWIRHLEHPHQ